MLHRIPVFRWLPGLLGALILSCGGGGGGGGASTQPTAVPVITSFQASPSTITLGQGSVLTWSVTGATNLSISGIGAVAGTSSAVTPNATTTYTLTASNAGGSATASAVITVNPPLPTIRSFSANPGTIDVGQSSMLTWDVSGASGLSISGIGSVTGTSTVISPTSSTTYTLTATNTAGSVIATTALTVNVPPPVIASFSASPASIAQGQSSTLTWNVTGAASLSIAGIGTVSGTSLQVSPTETATYVLSAANSSGTTTASATVTVVPTTVPLISSFTATPSTIVLGQASTLAWSVTGAASLSISGLGVVTGSSISVMPSLSKTYVLTATNAVGSSMASAPITVSGTGPAITAFEPDSGPVGTMVLISGANFGGTTTVAFNGTASTFTLNGTTEISVTVPPGATTGQISVTTPGGVGLSPSPFTVPSASTPINLLQNPGFEAGRSGWLASDLNKVVENTLGRTGSWRARLGGSTVVTSDQLWQDVAIPANVTSATLSLFVQVSTDDVSTVVHDTLQIQIRDVHNGVLRALGTLSNLDAGGAYVQKSYDLTAFKGQTTRIYLVADSNLGLATNFFVDDLALNVVAPSGLAPVITSFSPSMGGPNTNVTVLGASFYQVQLVRLNGRSLPFTLDSANQLHFSVPNSYSSGPITVLNPLGTGTSAPAQFTVSYTAPSIASFSPNSGPVGASVVINGSGFSTLQGVSFNGTQATFTINSDAKVTATVPAGATSGFLTLRNLGGTTISADAFTVTASTLADFSVEAAYLTQSVQTLGGTVPLVRNRDGLLRVFLKADQANGASPLVRVKIFQGQNVMATLDIPSPGAAVPTSIQEGNLALSWNVAIPGSLIQPGYSLIAEADPGGLAPDRDRSNNLLPRSGTPMPMNVQTLPPWRVSFFPVVLAAGTGNVSLTNVGDWTDRLRRMYPMDQVDATVGAPFTPSVADLTADGGGWAQLLNDLETKRLLEGRTDRTYFGAVKVAYGNGISGMGYIGSSASIQGRSAVGWDKTGYPDGGNYPEVFAHEVGHTLGRRHAPCGTPSNPDLAYPYAGPVPPAGSIGAFGLDVGAFASKDPALFRDALGYCSPTWVSDYTYAGILAFRMASPPASAASESCLVIRGRMDDSSAVLEPAFWTQTPRTAPSGSGVFQAETLDAQGRLLATLSFEPLVVGCSGERHFVVALPCADPGQVAGLRLLKEQVPIAERRPSAFTQSANGPGMRGEMEGERVHLQWNGTAFPSVAVRNAETGEILAFGQGGDLRLDTSAVNLEILASEGCTSRSLLVSLARDFK